MTIGTGRPTIGRGAILTFVTLLTVTVTGCNNDDTSDLPPPPSPGGTREPASSTIDPVHQAILDVYEGSVQAAVAAQRAGDRDHPDLARYLGGNTPALFDVQEGVDRHEARGTLYQGELRVVAAEVTDLELDAEPPVATIEACLDDTDYRLVYREDGSPVPDTEPGGRYSVTSTASRGSDDDRWYIVQSVAHWDEPC